MTTFVHLSRGFPALARAVCKETRLLYQAREDYGVTRFHKIFYVSRSLRINPVFDVIRNVDTQGIRVYVVYTPYGNFYSFRSSCRVGQHISSVAFIRRRWFLWKESVSEIPPRAR